MTSITPALAGQSPEKSEMDKREKRNLRERDNALLVGRKKLIVDLHKLLEFIVKDNGHKGSVGRALYELEFAANDYRLSKKYFVDPYDGSEVFVTLKEERARLTRIRDSLVKALNEAQSNPFNAFCKQISKDLERLVLSTSRALQNENEIPNREEDEDREYLAWQVALVFRDVLGIKAARTRDNPTKERTTYKGAAFAKVLRLTFGLARISGWKTKDLGRDLAAGLALIKNDKTGHRIGMERPEERANPWKVVDKS